MLLRDGASDERHQHTRDAANSESTYDISTLSALTLDRKLSQFHDDQPHPTTMSGRKHLNEPCYPLHARVKASVKPAPVPRYLRTPLEVLCRRAACWDETR